MSAENATATWEWLNVPEAASRTGMSVGTLRRLLNTHKILGVNLGSRSGWKVRLEDINHWMSAEQAKQAAQKKEAQDHE